MEWESLHDLAMLDPFQDDADGAAFGDKEGDIVVVGRDTIKLKAIAFDQYNTFTKKYFFLKNNEELNISIFRMEKGIYEPYKVLISCGGSEPIKQTSYTRSVINSDKIILSFGSKTVYIETTSLNYTLYTNAGTTDKPVKLEITNGFTLYGDEMISLLGSSSEYPAVSMSEVIDTMRCGENILSDGFNKWVDLQVVPDANGVANIEVIPIIGIARKYSINVKDAPFIKVSDLLLGGESECVKVGLDNYEQYKDDDKVGKGGGYKKFDNDSKYCPNILLTTSSPEKIKIKFETYDKTIINGLCRYNFKYENAKNTTIEPVILSYAINFEKEVSIPSGFESSIGLVMNRETEVLNITDKNGNIRGKVIFVKAAVNTTLNYNVVLLKYKDKIGYEQELTEKTLNNAFNQIGIGWNRIGGNTVTIEDEDIPFSKDLPIKDEEGNVSMKTFYGSDFIDALNSGTTTLKQTDDFEAMYQYIYKNKLGVKLTELKLNGYIAVFLPNSLYKHNGFAALGSNYATITSSADLITLPHEFGHCLNLKHIGEELNNPKNESELKTNNVMGYSSKNFSFWHWQKEIINK